MTTKGIPASDLDLWSRWLAKEALSSDESARLETLLNSPKGPWQELMEDRRLDGALKTLSRVASETDRFVNQVMHRRTLELERDAFVDAVPTRLTDPPQARTGSRRRWHLALAFSAGVLCAVSAVQLLGTTSQQRWHQNDELQTTQKGEAEGASPVQNGPARLASVEVSQAPLTPTPMGSTGAVIATVRGPAVIVNAGIRRRATPGMALTSTDQVETDIRSNVVVRFQDGTLLDLGRSTLVTSLSTVSGKPDERRITLARGTLIASVTPRSATTPITTFSTLQAHVKVVGTELSLRASPEATHVFVQHGLVEVRRSESGTPIELRAHQWTTVRATGDVIATAIRGKILFVTGNLILTEGDQQVLEHLETNGWAVTVMTHQQATAADGLGKTLVIISNTTESTELDLAFRDLGVPIISNEPWFFDELGMTWANEGNRHMNQTSVIVHSTHPLAARFKGVVRVSHAPFSLVWGRPGPGAEWVASATDNSSLAPIFAYERGAPMQGVIAPARRVGFFLAEDTGATLTEDGWTLFDAAVNWCSEP